MSQLADDLYGRDSLALPMALMAGKPPEARLFSERLGTAYLSFVNMIKLKTFRRYEGCNTTLQVLKINMRLVETVYVIYPLIFTSE